MNRPNPPKRALNFLRWFCREDYLDEIEGDLLEIFEQQHKQTPLKANRLFIWNVLLHFHPAFIKKTFFHSFNQQAMLRHNLLISIRAFQRYRTSFFINLIGLSSGLACVLFIYLWVQDELNVDTFLKNDQSIQRVMVNYNFPNEVQTWNMSPELLAKSLQENYPEVIMATNTSNNYTQPKGIIANGSKQLLAKGLFASENFFKMFSYELIKGVPQKVLSNPSNIVISEQLAIKLFNSTDEAFGNTLAWKIGADTAARVFQITGIFAKPPSTATQQFDAIIRMEQLVQNDPAVASWSDGYAETFVLLKPNANLTSFQENIRNYLTDKHTFWKPSELILQPYSDKYLYGKFENGKLAGGRITYVRLFSLIALFILLIACINFMNLSTAQATQRIKEIGVKKTMGVTRKILIIQFLSESMLMAIAALLTSLILVQLLMPQFNLLTGKELALFTNTAQLLPMLGIVVITGFLAGSYPSWYLSRFEPVSILKGHRAVNSSKIWVRKGLVVVQFTLSIVFIVAVWVVNEQMHYTNTKHLGYQRENIIQFQRNDITNSEVFLNKLQAINGVNKVATLAGDFLNGNVLQMGYSWQGKESDKDVLFKSPMISYDAIETLKMEMLMGRAFSKEYGDDATKLIVNEKAVEMMQLEKPVGTIINKDVGNGKIEKREIIGVVKDFHYGSIHSPIEPMILRFRPAGRNILVKLQSEKQATVLEQIELVYKEFYPGYPFTFSFLDEDYQQLYEAESKVATLSQYFTILAVLISCLGLFGLATFTAERRRKEMGIRKVLGANLFGLVKLLSQEYTRLVFLAILIGLPLSYWAASYWIERFAYRITLSWWFFAGAAIVSILIAWLSVSIQTLRAASVNPIKYLKDE